MKTKIEKLEAAVKNYRGNVKTSLIECLNKGFTRTGKSGYSKGWASKSVWTAEVRIALRNMGIKFEYDNDAPRGGASGEFVIIADKTLLKQIKGRSERLKKEAIEAGEKADKEAAEAHEKAIAYINTLPSIEALESRWNSLELKSLSGLSWSDYRNNLKEQYPNEWQILKSKFKAGQIINS